MIITINGKIGAGKDTVGRIIQYLTLEGPQNLLFGAAGNFSFQQYCDAVAGHHPMNKFQIVKFADELKEITAKFLGLRRSDLELQEVKDRILGDEWQIVLPAGKTTRTVRWFMQQLGTEAIRECIHPNAWVNALFSNYKSTFKGLGLNLGDHFPNWIITDMRFNNEMQAVVDREGITIRIKRPGTDVGSTHESETGLDHATFDYEINNDGTIEELVEKVREILIVTKII